MILIIQNLTIIITFIIIVIMAENSYNLDMSIAASYIENSFLFFMGMELDYIFQSLLHISTAI